MKDAAVEILDDLDERAFKTKANLSMHLNACPVCWREMDIDIPQNDGGAPLTRSAVLLCKDGLTLVSRRERAAAIADHFRSTLSTFLGVKL